MEILKSLGYSSAKLLEFAEMQIKNLRFEDKTLISKIDNLLIYYNEKELEQYLSKPKLYIDMTWQRIECMIRDMASNEHSTITFSYINFFKCTEWSNIYKVLGPALMIFIVKYAVLCVAVSPGAFSPLNIDHVQSLLREAEKTSKKQNLPQLDERKKMFLKNLSLKCKKKTKVSESKSRDYHHTVLPRKKKNKSKKKTFNTRRTTRPNIEGKRGYKENRPFTTNQFIYCRKADDTWFHNHVLSNKSSKTVKFLEKEILEKNVGINIPDIDKKPFHDNLNNALGAFLKNHRKRSRHVYKILLFNYFNTKVTSTHDSLRDGDCFEEENISQPHCSKSIIETKKGVKRFRDEECDDNTRKKPRLVPEVIQKGDSKKTKKKKKKEDKIQPVKPSIIKNYIRRILNDVIPITIFGCTNNKMKFIRYCCKFVDGCKSQKFQFGTLMRKMKISKIRWLQNLHNIKMKENLLAKVCAWMIEDFVMVLIKCFFYVTEMSYGGKKLVFYLKRDYERIWNTKLSEMKQNGKLKVIRKKIIESRKTNKNFVGIGRIRFLPKRTGCRPIIYWRYENSIKSTLKKICILLMQKQAEGLSNPYLKLVNMHKDLRIQFLKSKENSSPLYFVRTDIIDAYGSIDNNRLLQILRNLIPQDEQYVLQKFKCFTMKNGNISCKYSYGYKHLPLAMPHNSVIINTGEEEIVDSNFLWKILQQTIQCPVVHIGQKYFMLMKGIPQGGQLSGLLCDIYYSHMDHEHLNEFQNDADFFLRAVDDYLYVTQCEDHGKRFLNLVQRGIPDYGCSMNREKTETNIKNSEIKWTDSISFYGYVIHTKTMQVEGNFMKYAHQDIAHYMTLPPEQPGRVLRQKISLTSSLKLDAICLDEAYNTRETVYRNVFASSLFQAFRFHGVVHHLFDPHQRNQFFLAKLICESAGRIGIRAVNLVKKHSLDSSLNFQTVLWITYKAYLMKLAKHSSIYAGARRAVYSLHRSVSRRIPEDICHQLENITVKMPDIFKTFQ